MTSAKSSYDVVVVGGGHNGLVAAGYAALSGLSVLVLERLDHTGGAAPYSPEARLPEALITDLGLDLRLEPGPSDTDELVRAVVPTLLRRLPLEREIRAQVDPTTWPGLVTNPLELHDRLRAATPRVDGGGAAVAEALDHAVRAAPVEVLTSAGVSAVRAEADGAEVTWHDGMTFHTVAARVVLANVAPWVLSILLGEDEDPATKPQGDRATVTLRLERPPRLRPGVDPSTRVASLHLGEETVTVSGPFATIDDALAVLDALLAEPVASSLVGVPGLLTPQEVEHDLAMPGGHWFHGDLDWPWAPNRARLDTPARQWGVQTDVDSVLVCGSGSRRGGGVTGLGGHSAAHAVLAML
ncbi:MAG: NAD(P)-binding protein [Nocardioides sp.]